MDEGRKTALRQLRGDFRTGIIVQNIFPDLHKAVGGFLDDVEEDRVKSKEGNVAQVDELWEILLTKGNKDFDFFCTVVEKGNLTRANNLRKAAGIGQYRSSSSQVPQGQPLALEERVLRGASAPEMHGRTSGCPEDWRGQNVLHPAIREDPVPQGAGALVRLAPSQDDGMRQQTDLQVAIRGAPVPQGASVPAPHDRHPVDRMGQPFARDESSTLPPGYMEDVDYGEEDTDGPPSGSNVTMTTEVNFKARAGEHLVQERIWNEAKSAVLCIRPNGELDEETGTAFIGEIGEAPDGTWILLSALHCFLEQMNEEGEDVEEVDGVAIEEQQVPPASRKEKVKKKGEIDLQSTDPKELKRIIQESNDSLLRDRILRYYYWFHYEGREQYVQLKGEDFVAKDVRVEYTVKRDIIAFRVDKAKIVEAYREIHPIKLANVKRASDPQRKGARFWCKRTAAAYGFPSGRPLSHSGGTIVKYITPTDVKTERIAYQVRTEGGSSGGPVFVTFGVDDPVVVAIHCESGQGGEACNYGTLLWPFLQRTYFEED